MAKLQIYHDGTVSGTALSQHDHLLLPNGKKLGNVESAELSTTLQGLGIPGVSPNNPRDANLAAYAGYLAGIHNAAADVAEAAWIANPTDVPGVDVRNGASVNRDLRDALVSDIRQKAGETAVNAWLNSQ